MKKKCDRKRARSRNGRLVLAALVAGLVPFALASADGNGGGGNSGDAVAAAQSGHVYKLRNANSGKVLGVLGMSKDDGGKALQWGDNGTRDHEWRLDLQSNGYYKLTNLNSNKVLAPYLAP